MRVVKLSALLLTIATGLFAARYAIEHVGKTVRLTDPQISPDGRAIAMVVSRANYEENRYDPELILIDVATRAQRCSRATAAA